MAILPSTAVSEYRAYMLMAEVPAGCIAVPVADNTGAPHLRMGEFAIIDTDDRKPRSGEVYLVQWESGRRSICSIKAYPNRCNDAGPEHPFEWWIGAAAYPWHKPGAARRSEQEMFALLRRYGPNDGPITDAGYLRSKLVGRVVGIFAAGTDGPMRDVTPERRAT